MFEFGLCGLTMRTIETEGRQNCRFSSFSICILLDKRLKSFPDPSEGKLIL